jgi:hypothetical protein
VTERTIRTTYYGTKLEALRNNSSSDANRAVATCVLHMQIDHYGAQAAEVYDTETGELHAAVRRWKDGSLRIVYQRDPRSHERKFAVAALLEGMK